MEEWALKMDSPASARFPTFMSLPRTPSLALEPSPILASKVIPSLIKHSTQAGNDMGVGIDDSKTPNAIRALYEAGITTFDTAEAYGPGGHPEHLQRVITAPLTGYFSRLYGTWNFCR